MSTQLDELWQLAVGVFVLFGFGFTAKFIGDAFAKPALLGFAGRFPRLALVLLVTVIGAILVVYVLAGGGALVFTVLAVLRGW
jgi:hypothetical protein